MHLSAYSFIPLPIIHSSQIFVHISTTQSPTPLFIHSSTYPSTHPCIYPLTWPPPPIDHLTFLEFLLHVIFCAKPRNGLLDSCPGRKWGANRGSPQRERDKPACNLLSPFVAWTLPNLLTSRVSGQTMMKCRWTCNEAQASSRTIRGKLICLPHRGA